MVFNTDHGTQNKQNENSPSTDLSFAYQNFLHKSIKAIFSSQDTAVVCMFVNLSMDV